MSALQLGFTQVLYLVALYVPMSSPRLGLPREARLGAGYLTSIAVALLIGYALDTASIFSAARMFWIWSAVCAMANVFAWKRCAPVCFTETKNEERRVRLLLTGVLLVTGWVRLVDPCLNTALAGIDSYNFVNYYTWVVADHKAIHYYPSGFALMTAMSPWRLNPYDAARWAPHFVFLASLLAAFGFWRLLGGTRWALLLTLLFGSAWFLFPFTGYYPHFIQWTTSFVCLPALLFLYPRCFGSSPRLYALFGIVTNFVFVLTSAYFSLLANALLLLLLVPAHPRTCLRWRSLGCALLVAVVPAVVLLGFYGWLARDFFLEWEVGIAAQAEIIAGTGAQPPSGDGLRHSAFLDLMARCVLPNRPLQIGPRWLLFGGVVFMGLTMWTRVQAARHVGIRLLSGIAILTGITACTGILELPAWQGRATFLSFFAGTALGLWWVQRWRLCRALCVRMGAIGRAILVLTIAGPSMAWPPMIGRNIPVSNDIRPRVLPGDNEVMKELLHRNSPGRRRTVAIIPSNPPVHLVDNLQRLKEHARQQVLPKYGLLVTRDADIAFSVDGVLASAQWLRENPLPSDFRIHTRGRDFIFALREADDPQNRNETP